MRKVLVGKGGGSYKGLTNSRRRSGACSRWPSGSSTAPRLSLARLDLTERAALRATMSKEKMLDGRGVSLALCAEFELLLKLGVAAGGRSPSHYHHG